MKTKEEILDKKKILKTAFSLIEIGENEDGSPHYLGTDSDRELDECVTIAESYASQEIEKHKELIEAQESYIKWLKTKPSINDIAHVSYKLKINKIKTELGL